MTGVGVRPRRVLDGVRVIDLTMAWAGPMATRVLAELGADVVKIEGATHMDRWRGGTFAQRGTARYPDGIPGERPWNRSSFHNTQNRNKRSLVLDLKSERGKDVFRSLVASADLVAENFGAGAMQRLGLDYPDLRRVNERVVMLSMPGFGRTGPERSYIAHGPTIEEMAGLAHLQGYADGPPTPSGALAWGDPVAGINGGLAAMMGLLHQQRAGVGQHIDLSHLESAVAFQFEAVLEYTVSGVVRGRVGNAHPDMAPHGPFPCRGEDRWVAIACRDDDEWARLVGLVGPGSAMATPRFAHLVGRQQAADELGRELATWTASQDRDDLARRLQDVGVTAGPVLDAEDLCEDPGLHARGFFRSITHPEAGSHRYPSLPWTSRRWGPWDIDRHAPLFGEHNSEVLTEVLGLSASQIDNLVAEGVVGTAPVPQGD